MGNIDLLYAAFNLTRPSSAETRDARLFYIYYGNGRSLQPADNRAFDVRNADRRHLAINTGVGHIVHVIPPNIGRIDLLG